MILTVACVLALSHMAVAGIGCRDEQGQPVDWFAAIKRNNSFGYAYMGPKSSDFSQSSMLLSDPSAGSISLTLAQLYGNQSLSYLFYNDEPPSSSSPSSYAHAKGEPRGFGWRRLRAGPRSACPWAARLPGSFVPAGAGEGTRLRLKHAAPSLATARESRAAAPEQTARLAAN